MQAPDKDDEGSGSVVGGAGPSGSPGGSPMGPRDRGSTGVESAAAGGAPQVEGVAMDSGQAGEASGSDRDLECQVPDLYLFSKSRPSPRGGKG